MPRGRGRGRDRPPHQRDQSRTASYSAGPGPGPGPTLGTARSGYDTHPNPHPPDARPGYPSGPHARGLVEPGGRGLGQARGQYGQLGSGMPRGVGVGTDLLPPAAHGRMRAWADDEEEGGDAGAGGYGMRGSGLAHDQGHGQTLAPTPTPVPAPAPASGGWSGATPVSTGSSRVSPVPNLHPGNWAPSPSPFPSHLHSSVTPHLLTQHQHQSRTSTPPVLLTPTPHDPSVLSIPGPHSAIVAEGAGAMHQPHATRPPFQTLRSWTLDSSAYQSTSPLQALVSAHGLPLPLTRSPLLEPLPRYAKSDSPSGRRGGRSPGGSGRGGGPKRGPPPKAKLGGPGGGTYEELERRAGRIVSAPADSPGRSDVATPGDTTSAVTDVGAIKEEAPVGAASPGNQAGPSTTDKPASPPKWKNKTIEVRLPPASYSPPDSPSRGAEPNTASSSGSGEGQEGKRPRKEAYPWPEHKISLSASAIPLPESPPVDAPLTVEDAPVAPWDGGEVVVSVPTQPTPAPERDSGPVWLPGPISQQQQQLTAGPTAEPRKRERTSSTTGTGMATSSDSAAGSKEDHEPAMIGRATFLRPTAPSFMPSFRGFQRSTSSPNTSAARQNAEQDSRGSVRSNRVVSDDTSDGPRKKLRPTAAEFEPLSVRGSTSKREAGAGTARQLPPAWLVNIPQHGAVRPTGPVGAFGAALYGDAVRAPGGVFHQPTLSSGSNYATFRPMMGMMGGFAARPSAPGSVAGSDPGRRSSNGQLRPVAASFVPQGSFTFNAPPPSAGSLHHASSAQADNRAVSTASNGAPTRPRSTDTFGHHATSERSVPTRAAAASPASALHDLPNDGPRDEGEQDEDALRTPSSVTTSGGSVDDAQIFFKPPLPTPRGVHGRFYDSPDVPPVPLLPDADAVEIAQAHAHGHGHGHGHSRLESDPFAAEGNVSGYVEDLGDLDEDAAAIADLHAHDSELASESGTHARGVSGGSAAGFVGPSTAAGAAHLPKESFGLPSPVATSHIEPRDLGDYFRGSSKGGRHATVTSLDADDVEPETPRIPDSPLHNLPTGPRGSRQLDAPATPQKTVAGEMDTPIHKSPTPARANRSVSRGRLRSMDLPRSPLFEEDNEVLLSATASASASASARAQTPIAAPGVSAPASDDGENHDKPTFRQPEITVDHAADDRRFRAWVFPTPDKAQAERPGIGRRHTLPLRDVLSDAEDEEGVASTRQSTLADRLSEFRGALAGEEAGGGGLGGEGGLGVEGDVFGAHPHRSVEFPRRAKELKVVNRTPVPGSRRESKSQEPSPRGPRGEDEGEAVGGEPRMSDESFALGRLGARMEEFMGQLRGAVGEVKRAVGEKDSRGGREEGLGAMASRALLKDFRRILHGQLVERDDHLEPIIRRVSEQAAELRAIRDGIASRDVSDVKAQEARERSTAEAMKGLSRAQQQVLDRLDTFADNRLVQDANLSGIADALAAIRLAADDDRKNLQSKDEVILALRQQITEQRLALQAAEAARDEGRAKVDKEAADKLDARRELQILQARLGRSEVEYEQAQREMDAALAASRAAEMERDGLAEALGAAYAARGEMEGEVEGLRRELNHAREKAEAAPPKPDAAANMLEEMGAANQLFRNDLFAQIAFLQKGVVDARDAQSEAVEALVKDKSALRKQVEDLRRQLDDAKSRATQLEIQNIQDAEKATGAQAVLQAKLETEQDRAAEQDERIADLQGTVDILREEKENLQMIATERSASMRSAEVRFQALAQENVYWRQFALSYDRKEYRRYMGSRPFRDKNGEAVSFDRTKGTSSAAKASDPAHQTPGPSGGDRHGIDKGAMGAGMGGMMSPVLKTPYTPLNTLEPLGWEGGDNGDGEKAGAGEFVTPSRSKGKERDVLPGHGVEMEQGGHGTPELSSSTSTVQTNHGY